MNCPFLRLLHQVATEIEKAVSHRFGPLTGDYLAKFRTLCFNLKDKDNWSLRTRVLLGEVTPSELVNMSEEALASERVKEDRERLHKEVMEKSVIHEHARGAVTNMYECPKCKKRECSFYEKQTRSADEPM
jgi:transcription elongation factor S-II